MEEQKTLQELETEIAQLRNQFEESNDAIEAIRSGNIDALVVKEDTGHQVYRLKTTDQTYRVFIEKMREGAVTLSSEGLILYSNTRFASMVDIPLSKVIGMPFNNFVKKEDHEIFSLLTRQGWEAEITGEICLLDNNKKTLPILISLITLELDEGKCLSIILTDLSAQKENERQLKLKNEELLQAHHSLTQLNNELEYRVAARTGELSESREHFRFLTETIPVIVWTSKPNGDRDYYNQRWYEYTGTTFDQSKGLNWQKAIHPDDLPGTIEAWTYAIKTGKDFYMEYRLLRASDNVYGWHASSGRPFKNENGKTIAWFGVITDIEDQKIALARKDEFISMVSHELKTPITVIKAYTEVLLSTFRDANNSKAGDFMIRMDGQVNKLSRLIAELLDATRANAGVMLYNKKYFDFNEMISETADQLRVTTETHRIELNLSQTCDVFGDRNRLSQVVSNLIGNAIKYSPRASRVIISSVVKGNLLKLSVQDFGIGVPASQQPKLFNRFFRAKDVKTSTFPGLGLGLYISNEIIKRHSGLLSFESLEGKGSTFSIEIPINPEQNQVNQ